MSVSSVTQSCPTLCDPMDCNKPGFVVDHQLLELAQTHVHRDSDAIQPSHPLLSPSLPAFNFPSIRVFPMSQFFASGAQSFSFTISPSNEYLGLISFRMDWFGLFAVWRVFSNTTVQKHQFLGAQPSSLSKSHIHTWPQEKPWRTLVSKVMSLLLNMLSRLVIIMHK